MHPFCLQPHISIYSIFFHRKTSIYLSYRKAKRICQGRQTNFISKSANRIILSSFLSSPHPQKYINIKIITYCSLNNHELKSALKTKSFLFLFDYKKHITNSKHKRKNMNKTKKQKLSETITSSNLDCRMPFRLHASTHLHDHYLLQSVNR